MIRISLFTFFCYLMDQTAALCIKIWESNCPFSLLCHAALIFCFFRLLPLGVATADPLSPISPARHIWHSNHSHVFSSLTTSMNLVFGLPLLLLPGNSKHNILLPIYSTFCLCTCSYHLNLASLTLSPICLTWAVPRINSFLILSIVVTPKENLNIFLTSATASSASCFLVNGTVSKTIQYGKSNYRLVNFPFSTCRKPSVADRSWHSPPVIPASLHSPLHLTTTTSITLYSRS